MNQTRKRLSMLTTAALLTALAILIPQVMPKIVIPPASFTLASHVPIMIGMLISPVVAVIVAVGSTIGFLISGLPIEITFRAATHVIFALIGSLLLILGIGGFIHSLIDFNIAMFIAKAINRVYKFDIFKD